MRISFCKYATSWFESEAVQDVTIRNNVFEECADRKNNFDLSMAPVINMKKMTNTDLNLDLKVKIK